VPTTLPYIQLSGIQSSTSMPKVEDFTNLDWEDNLPATTPSSSITVEISNDPKKDANKILTLPWT